MERFSYKLIEEDGYPVECELCGCTAPLIESERLPMPNRGETHRICEVCHTTHCIKHKGKRIAEANWRGRPMNTLKCICDSGALNGN